MQQYEISSLHNELDTMDDVLVVVAGHVTNEEKKQHVVQLLNTLKQENLNVCYVTHAPNYLEELSTNIDFLYYDKNNLLVDHKDYLIHSDLFDDSSGRYGLSNFWSNLPFGTVRINSMAEHCPALTILLKNAVDIANTNHFKWIVFIEYDILPPNVGFSQFIKDKLKLLTENNKKCLLYPRPDDGFMYPGILIFTPTDVLEHPIFLKKDWYSSPRNWIDTWKLGFSESIAENVFNEVFKDSVLEYSIAKDAKTYWGLDDYSKIHIYSQFAAGHHQTLRLIPYRKENKFFIALFMNNMNSCVLNISNLTVVNKSTNTIIYNIPNKSMNPSEWYFDTLDNNLFDINNDLIELQFTLNLKGVTLSERFSYNLKYIENIYNYICKLEL